jgi:hypothetical protein
MWGRSGGGAGPDTRADVQQLGPNSPLSEVIRGLATDGKVLTALAAVIWAAILVLVYHGYRGIETRPPCSQLTQAEPAVKGDATPGSAQPYRSEDSAEETDIVDAKAGRNDPGRFVLGEESSEDSDGIEEDQ